MVLTVVVSSGVRIEIPMPGWLRTAVGLPCRMGHGGAAKKRMSSCENPERKFMVDFRLWRELGIR